MNSPLTLHGKNLMRGKLQKFGLLGVGVIVGILISLNFSANADKEDIKGLPIDELRSFADVFSAIKQGYVEPVDDKKLITYAISGMLSNLDPHSAYLDAEAFKDLQVSTQGEFGGLGLEVGMEDGFVKALTIARNLGRGAPQNFTTVDLDMQRHYRPRVNVVQRPTARNGKGYEITGHHEIMVPLLVWAIVDELARLPESSGRQ